MNTISMTVREINVKMVALALMVLLHIAVVVHLTIPENIVKLMSMNVP